MVSKVNLKARINRHSRILKDNLWNIHPFRYFYHKFNYNIVFFLIVFLLPVYPLFSSFFYENTVYDFYRWDIDESSILDSYIDISEDNSIIVSHDSFISINTLMEWSRDVSGFSEIIEYEIKPGDSLSLIAQKFWVSNNSILWANNFDAKKVLHPGEVIKVPPVSGLIHEVKSGDTVTELAKKYKVDAERILSQNGLTGSSISVGQNLIIPWAIKEVPKPVVVQASRTTTPTRTTTTTTSAQGWYNFAQGGNSEFVDTDGVYKLVKRQPQWTFYWGNCTRYVAQYKNVNWSGNAKDWLRNAKAKWHSTGSAPWIWAIVVFHGKWYNPVYGHVWIVIDITATDIIVKDMNYRKLNEVTVRKVPKTDRAIQWYIYVD